MNTNFTKTSINDLIAHAAETGLRLPVSAVQIADDENNGIVTDLVTGERSALVAGAQAALINGWGKETFAKIWLNYQREIGGDPSYCRLAVAMAKADQQADSWGFYIELARQNLAQIHDDETYPE